jgi:hypothetical protein
MSRILQAMGLQSHPTQAEGETILIAQLTYRDGTSAEERITVKRSEIDKICEEYEAREEVAEVWVFQKIYHHKKAYTDDKSELGVVGIALGGAMGLAD